MSTENIYKPTPRQPTDEEIKPVSNSRRRVTVLTIAVLAIYFILTPLFGLLVSLTSPFFISAAAGLFISCIVTVGMLFRYIQQKSWSKVWDRAAIGWNVASLMALLATGVLLILQSQGTLGTFQLVKNLNALPALITGISVVVVTLLLAGAALYARYKASKHIIVVTESSRVIDKQQNKVGDNSEQNTSMPKHVSVQINNNKHDNNMNKLKDLEDQLNNNENELKETEKKLDENQIALKDNVNKLDVLVGEISENQQEIDRFQEDIDKKTEWLKPLNVIRCAFDHPKYDKQYYDAKKLKNLTVPAIIQSGNLESIKDLASNISNKIENTANIIWFFEKNEKYIGEILTAINNVIIVHAMELNSLKRQKNKLQETQNTLNEEKNKLQGTQNALNEEKNKLQYKIRHQKQYRETVNELLDFSKLFEIIQRIEDALGVSGKEFDLKKVVQAYNELLEELQTFNSKTFDNPNNNPFQPLTQDASQKLQKVCSNKQIKSPAQKLGLTSGDPSFEDTIGDVQAVLIQIKDQLYANAENAANDITINSIKYPTKQLYSRILANTIFNDDSTDELEKKIDIELYNQKNTTNLNSLLSQKPCMLKQKPSKHEVKLETIDEDPLTCSEYSNT